MTTVNALGRPEKIAGALARRELPDEQHDLAAETVPSPSGRSVGGGRRHAERRDRVNGLDAPRTDEDSGATVDAENAVADADHRVDASEHALADPGGIEPAIEEGQSRA